jgi:hypothetical protein
MTETSSPRKETMPLTKSGADGTPVISTRRMTSLTLKTLMP